MISNRWAGVWPGRNPVKENVRAKMRVMVRRILRKPGYPPDNQEKATQTVLEQAELMAEGPAA